MSCGVSQTRVKAAAALVLTLASGLVDIVGYLGVYRAFTAHVTGTTVKLGRDLVRENWGAAAIGGATVVAFFAGSLAGRALLELGARHAVRRVATGTLALEATMIAGVAHFTQSASASHSSGTPAAVGMLIAVLAFAMGLQTATLTRIGPLTVHTTFVTGMVNKLSEVVSHILFRAYDLAVARQPADGSRARLVDDAKRAVFLGAIWVSYVLGAAAGAWAYTGWKMKTLYVATGLLLLAIAADQFWELSYEDEMKQAEG